MTIRGIAFDAYGTLFDVFSVSAAIQAELGEVGDEVLQTWRSKQLAYTWLLSLMGRYEDFWTVTGRALDYACAAAGLSDHPERRSRLLDAYLHLSAYPEVDGALGALEGWRRVILSNGSRRMLEAVVRNSGLQARFEAILSADAAKVFKPSPRVYQLACAHFGLPPEAIAFVSSNAWDVAGARSFGFYTIWVNRGGQTAEALGLTAHVETDALSDLERLLP